jgi:hypothetical protein
VAAYVRLFSKRNHPAYCLSSPTDYHVPRAICHLPLTDCLSTATAISRHFELSSHRATYQHCNLISAFAPVYTRARYTNVHFTVPREGSLSGVNIPDGHGSFETDISRSYRNSYTSLNRLVFAVLFVSLGMRRYYRYKDDFS